jgi:hypothetical protein
MCISVSLRAIRRISRQSQTSRQDFFDSPVAPVFSALASIFTSSGLALQSLFSIFCVNGQTLEQIVEVAGEGGIEGFLVFWRIVRTQKNA